MEEALGCSHTSLSADFDVDGEVNFAGKSGALHVDYSDGVYFLLVLQTVHNTNQVLGLSRLAYYHYSLIFSDVVSVQFGWVGDMELFEALEHFEKRLAGISSVVAGATGNHAEI